MSFISERQAAKMALLMRQQFSAVQQAALSTKESRDYLDTIQDEMAEIFRELAKPNPDKAKILAWVSKYGGDEGESAEDE